MRQEEDKRKKDNLRVRRDRGQRIRKLLYESFSTIKLRPDGNSMRVRARKNDSRTAT